MYLERRAKVRILAVLLITGCLVALLALPIAASAHAPLRPFADAPWGANARVNDDAGTADQNWPDIAVDPSGNGYAVWHDFRNGDADIYFSYRPVGGSWDANVKVNDDAGTATQTEPSIAVDPGGNAYAVWTDSRNGNADIYFSYRPAGGPWGTNVKVNADVGIADQHHSDIAVDASGGAYAIWRDYRNVDPDIYFSYRPAGGPWGTNVKVNDDAGTADQDHPSIAADPNGNAHAAWRDERGGDYDIYSSYRPAGGSWDGNAKLNDDVGTANQYAPSVAVDLNGNAYAVWQDRRGPQWDIYFAYRPAGGAWGSNVKVNDNGGMIDQEDPCIAVDPCGNAYVAWTGYSYVEGYIYDIHSSWRPAGDSWAANVRVNDDVGPAWHVGSSIGVDSIGNAYAVWQDNRNDNWDIYFSYLPSQIPCPPEKEFVPEEFVPELSTLSLLGSGLAGLAGYATLRWRTRK
jgi:hypothetical protein